MARATGGAAIAPPGSKPPKGAGPLQKSTGGGGIRIAGRPPRVGVNPPPPPAPNQNPSATRGHWVPVGDKWVLIHAIGKNQWVQGGVPGSPHPPKPHGPTPLPTNPLAPLTPGQIRRTATGTIKGAYAPEFSDLGNQQTTAQNIYKTQSQDAKYFSDWLAQKNLEMTGAVGQVNSQLASLVQGINQRTADQQAQIPGMAAANQALTGGNASNIYQQQIPGVLAGQGLRAQGQESAAATQAMLGPVDIAQAGTVNQARVQALRGQQFDQLNKTLQGIAQTRTKLLLSQTGDIEKEIARLQGVEIQKRQYLMSQSALEKQLNLKQQAQYATNLLNQGKLKVAQTQAQTARERAQETARHNAAMETINSKHYASQADHNAAVERERQRHDKAMEGIGQQNANTRAAGGTGPGGKGAKPATRAQQAHIRQQINGLIAALKADYNKYHRGDPNGWAFAYHDLLNGNAAKAGIVKGGAYTGDVGLLNAAYNVATGSGLSPGDVSFLQQQGLSNIGGYYQIHKQPSGGRRPPGAGGPGNRG